ncbi:MAG: RICIN domain-containing protein [Flavobacteriales bacterium]
MKYAFFILIGIIAIISIVVVPRIRKDINKKLSFENTYAIQNVASETVIRAFNAGTKNENKIIGYSHKNWECVTWEMIDLGENTFLLKNLFTEKTFQPKSTPKSGVGLWQQSMGGTTLQHWEFLKQADETYKIRLKNTDLFITISSNEIDAPLILMPNDNSDKQNWKLIRQTPWI